MPNAKIRAVQGFKFQPFSEKQMKLLNWWAEDSPVKDKYMCIADGSVRSGKSQSLDSILYTPDGYKLMGDIKVGDYVFDRLGNPTKVLGVFPQGELDIYKITFHDGSSTECSLNHLWSYTTKKCKFNGNLTVFTSTLSDIMNDLERFKYKKHMHQRAGKYLFPLAKGVNFNEREVKIDPYMLGLLLGDGCFSNKCNGINFTNDEFELHDYLIKISYLYDMRYTYNARNDSHCARGWFRHLNNKPNKKVELRNLLESYNLFGCKSYNKFVPDDYKYNSKQVRLSILAGLLNTDGSVYVKNRPGMMFCSVSKQLRDDVVFLARSLGLWCSTERKDDIRDGRNICYTCYIRVNNELYLLLSSKHRDRLNLDTDKSKDFRIIKSIEYVGKKECQCIYVDNEEHLYLTDDFIVTHNTISICLSFLLYVMSHFNHQMVAMAGKSVGSVKRNIIVPLKGMLITLGYEYIEHRSENYLEISKGNVTNYFHIFGLKDVYTKASYS